MEGDKMKHPETIGSKLKELRKRLNLSQCEVAKDICHQSLISQIENGQVIPTATLLYMFGKRLGVEPSYFFQTMEQEKEEYIKIFKNHVSQEIRNRNYQEVKNLLVSEKKNPTFQGEFKQFILWHEGICSYYINGDAKKSISLMNQALSEYPHTTLENRIEIMNSIAIVYSEEKLLESSIEMYELIYKELKKLPINSSLTKLKFYYNYSIVLTRKGEINKSISLCRQGINLSIESRSLVCFGDLYYQLGYNYFKLNNYRNALKYMNIAKGIFIAEKNNIVLEHVEKRIGQVMRCYKSLLLHKYY